jgi:signal transduction histidine kinase
MTSATPAPGLRLSRPSTPAVSGARRFGRIVVTVVAVVCSLFLGLLAFGQWVDGTSAQTTASPWAVLGLLATIATAGLLCFRRRLPLFVTLACAGLALLLPTSALPAAVALHVLLSQRGAGAPQWWSLGVVYAASVSAVAKDMLAPNSLLGRMSGGVDGAMPEDSLLPLFAPFIAAVLLTPFVAIGFARGASRQRDRAARQNAQLTHSTEVLHDRVARDRERQAAAREIHDTLASRLSALSLNAGALELSAEGDEEAARAARAVRESAQRSLDDLRHVVQILRNPDSSIDAGKRLAELRQLVDEAHSVGDPVRSSVLIDNAASCPPEVAHAAYRVVQEALSNARRHAPGAPVTVDVHGGPTEGLTVTVANEAGHARRDDRGTGHGILGMRERVLLVGGEFDAAPTGDGGFRVTARIPWH